MFNNFSWICPFCHRNTTVVAPNYSEVVHYYFRNIQVADGIGIRTTIIACPNPDCFKHTVEAFMYEVQGRELIGNPLFTWRLRPSSSATPQPEYIPLAIRQDYEEACAIQDLSPKAAATLARRCLQGMIRDFWGIKKNRLIDEIKELNGKIESSTWNVINAVREIGNIGAHMEEDVNLIIDVESEEVLLLIKLIEDLFQSWYIARHDREERSDQILEIAKQKKSQKTAVTDSTK